MGSGKNGAVSRAVLASAILSMGWVASGAQAQVVISKDRTSNMSCSAGECTGTASQAVLNVKDLKKALAQGNLTVEAGAALSIEVETAVTWAKPSTLTLEGMSIAIADSVKAEGHGNVVISAGGNSLGPAVTFPGKGSIGFLNTSSSVTINGTAYRLENSLESLAADIAADLEGNFALANDYDAGADGVYGQAVVPRAFQGAFEGLGHTVTNLSIKATAHQGYVGLFGQLYPSGLIRDIKLAHVNISGGRNVVVGGVVGDNQGGIRNVFVSGKVGSGKEFESGGVTGYNFGTISQSMSSANVRGNAAGGLVGEDDGIVENSFATGAVLGTVGSFNQPVSGGLVGLTSPGTIEFSYSTGHASGGAVAGGAVGNCFMTSATDVYWDTTTSVNTLGCGEGSASVTGLTTAQLQSGLPAGFDPSIWNESAGANKGLPYLLALGPN